MIKNKKFLFFTSFVSILPISFLIVSCSSPSDNKNQSPDPNSPVPEPEKPPVSQPNINEEVKRVDNLQIRLKKNEYTTDEIDEINENTIKDNIVGFSTTNGFTYKFIDLVKPPIEYNDSQYFIKFKIQINLTKTNETKNSKEFSLGFKISKAEIEAQRIFNLNLELIKPKLTQDEVNQINNQNILSKIKDINLNLNQFNYEVFDFNNTNSIFTFSIKIIDKSDQNNFYEIYGLEVPYQLVSSTPLTPNQEILDKCVKSLKASCSLTNEEKSKLKPSEAINQHRNSFSINESEIKAINSKVGINGFTFDIDYKKHPTSVVLKVLIWVGKESDPDYVETAVYKEINGFKSEIEVGLLDSQPIVNLKTPTGSQSYKGQLEKFAIKDISLCGNNQYNDYLRQTSWDDVKLNFMYQVRFALYQMFSDNFSEVNYYISNEVNERSFNAIAEGIVKNKANNVNYGFQYLNNAQGTMRSANLNPGDRIKIQIRFETSDGNYKPSLLDRGDMLGEFTYSWWWNFDNNCNRFYDRNNPNFVDNLYRDNWMGLNKRIRLSIWINNNQTYSLTPNQYSSYNFVLKRKAPNN